MNWVKSLTNDLKLYEDKRVMTFAELLELARIYKPGLSAQSFRNSLPKILMTGLLEKPAHGVYMNMSLSPKPTPKELAGFIRKGSVISLSSALAGCGALQKSSLVTAVIPLSESPNLREVKTDGARFRFYGLPNRFFDDEWMRKDAAYPCFIPEKALLDWIHLGSSGRSTLPPPPLDMKVSKVDLKKAFEISQKLGLTGHLEEWLLRVSVSSLTHKPKIRRD